MASHIPDEMMALLAELSQGVSRAGLAERSERISRSYRERLPSAGLITDNSDVLAYAMSRLPATYAALDAVLEALQDRAPELEPRSALDVGAGPGTASWAAAGRWDSVSDLTLLDHNRQFLGLAETLARRSASPALNDARTVLGDFSAASGRKELAGRRFDLVIASYAATEIAGTALPGLAEALWAATGKVLVIVEPGRPRDYKRLMTVRAQLIGLGGTVIAPCPHDGACPLLEPDWCHFSIRLSRNRDHMRLKGASMAYEDEKFSYLVVARPGVEAMPAAGRIVKPVTQNKFEVRTDVCTAGGVQQLAVAKRDRAAFKRARKYDWGDAITLDEDQSFDLQPIPPGNFP